MTTVTGTTATTATTGTSLTSTASTTPTSQAYNSQLFLKLLTTQLANQDPSSPMDSGQMVEQTSQLASMEQLTNLTSTATSTYQLQQRDAAANVLGKVVSWTDSDGNAKSGTVSAVAFSGTGDPTLTVGSSTLSLSDVTGIATAAAASSSTS